MMAVVIHRVFMETVPIQELAHAMVHGLVPLVVNLDALPVFKEHVLLTKFVSVILAGLVCIVICGVYLLANMEELVL